MMICRAEWMCLLIGIFWQTGIIFLGLLDKTLILITIRGRQKFNAKEKTVTFFEKLKIKRGPLK